MDNLHTGEFLFSNDIRSTNLDLMTRALDASNSGIVITDNSQPDNPIIYCNKAFESISGYNRKEIIGRNCRFLQKEDRDQEMRKVLKEAINKNEDCFVEIRNYRKDGTLFWNELYMSAIKNQAGETTHFVGVQNDVSRRKKAELALIFQKQEMEKRIEERTRVIKENEEYLASIISTVRESLIVLDKDHHVLSVNDHFLKTFKVAVNDVAGRDIYELGNGQWNIPALREMLNNVLPTNNPIEGFEVEHDFPHIGRKLMLVNANRIELEGEYRDRILIAIEDITERREIEVRKDDFLSIASHELKTPLTTVKGYVQLMARHMPESASDKFKNIVDKTSVYVERLNSLLVELLDVSRIQTGHLELHRNFFNFDKVIHETVEGIQAATKSHNIVIKGKATDAFTGDESHIVQVVNNLLANAIKYAPDSPEITVYLSVVSDYLKVSVTDHGLGINAEDQKRIFERFFRVGDIQQRFPGMGIGLYVCEQIIKNHGGSLWVESEKGSGSTFSFTLPLQQSETDE